MGSSAVESFVRDDAIHVGRDLAGHWWAVGKEGSFGGSMSRQVAISIAKDASATAHHGKRRIVVHYIGGTVQCVITRTRVKPSSQFFQDAVP